MKIYSQKDLQKFSLSFYRIDDIAFCASDLYDVEYFFQTSSFDSLNSFLLDESVENSTTKNYFNMIHEKLIIKLIKQLSVIDQIKLRISFDYILSYYDESM